VSCVRNPMMNALIIFLKLCIALLSCSVCGYGLTKLTRMSRTVAVPAGYALTQVLYFVAYLLLFSPTAAFVLAVAIPTATTLYTFRHRARYSSIEESTSQSWP